MMRLFTNCHRFLFILISILYNLRYNLYLKKISASKNTNKSVTVDIGIEVPQTTKVDTSWDPATPLVSFYLIGSKTTYQRYLHTGVYCSII